MAYDSTTGTMYAVTGCPSGSSLYTIDINTGATTLVGAMANEACTVSIAIDSAGQMYGVDIVNDALYAIDKTNGTDALIGSIGFNANYAQEMTFDLSTDILYYAAFNLDLFNDYMYTIDTGTGTANLIGQIISGTGGFAELDGMGIETAVVRVRAAAGSAVAVAQPAHRHDGTRRFHADHRVARWHGRGRRRCAVRHGLRDEQRSRQPHGCHADQCHGRYGRRR